MVAYEPDRVVFWWQMSSNPDMKMLCGVDELAAMARVSTSVEDLRQLLCGVCLVREMTPLDYAALGQAVPPHRQVRRTSHVKRAAA